MVLKSELARVGGGPWLRGTIPSVGAVEPMPFLAETEGVEALWPVHRQHAVEVIDFVLQ